MTPVLRIAVCAVVGIVLSAVALTVEAATIVDTKHNLSITGPGDIKALTETRVCIFCHTPHNANPRTPLWNRDVGSQTYVLYTSSTIVAAPEQPNGPSRLCLSCHDGTIALGAVLQPSSGIQMVGQITPDRPSNIGANQSLAGDHPISFSYYDAAADPGIYPDLPQDLIFYTVAGKAGYLECTTCHDAHEDQYTSLDKNGHLTGKFLRADPRSAGLCLKCHVQADWVGSIHQQSTAPVPTDFFPVSPRTWPTWETIAEWGCGICHTSHSSQSGQWLWYYATEAEVCAPCHGAVIPGASVAGTGLKNIAAQTRRISAHRMNTAPSLTNPKKGLLSLPGQTAPTEVTCSDCHNPHLMRKSVSPQRDGKVTGGLRGVSGIDRNGAAVASATYEYEVCYKCHSDYAGQFPYVPRVIDTVNTRLEFDGSNPSFHPVQQRGKNPNVPSIPSTYEPALTVSSIMRCTDCHSDDSGTKGPHGSSFPPILRERYETADNTLESYQSYALCYRCHNRAGILSDMSFRKKAAKTTATGGGHSGHLAKGAPCSACHDAHGVNVTTPPPPPGTGDHTRLINFDTRIVAPNAGNAYPFFNQRGAFSGSCTLVCHGRSHVNESYP
ncbi:MAG: hypothetical protein M1497_15170 [Nitrospirae bacterium]|nr:hypothetical protein [Nitrospirota bacterium]